MKNYWMVVKGVLDQSDLIIEVLDARLIEETRNAEIEDKIRKGHKKLLYVITKCDLVDISELKKKQKGLYPSVYISSNEKLGTTILKKKILELSRGRSVVVGVVGYPNVGKSSLINALAGRHSARTSPESGFTKGFQRIRVDNKILLLDTPGVFPYKEKNELKHGLIGALDYSKIKEAEIVALEIIERYKEKIKKHYRLPEATAEELLEEIAYQNNFLQKKGVPNLEAAARLVLKHWQTGKIK